MKFSILPFFIAFFIVGCSSSQEPYKRIKQSGAAHSLDMWVAQRSFPEGKVRTDVFEKEFDEYKRQTAIFSNRQSDVWQPIGPMNFGGRTLYLAFNPQNPNTLYAGSASGGLWRSHSAGVGVNAWHHVPTGFPVMGVAAIAIEPNDSNTIYIGTGEVYNYQSTGDGVGIRTQRGTYGIGILKSTDGGQSWQKSLDWNYDELRGVQDIQINRLRSQTVWAATSEGTYKSYDGGTNWTLAHTVLMANEIVFHPADTSIFFISCGNLSTGGYGIYRTIDGGQSFIQITTTQLSGKIMMDISPNPPYSLYGSFADWDVFYGLFSTDDLGDNWTFHNSTDYSKWQGWYSHDVAINPSDPNHIMCSGIDLWKSTNGGDSLTQKTWYQLWDFSATPIGGPEGPSNYIHGDIHRVFFHPTDHNTIYMATDGGIFRSTDGGETFEGCNGMYQTQQFYADFSNSRFDSLFAIGGLQDNATCVYEGNLAWRRVVGGDGMNSIIDPTDENIVYVSYQWGNILKSTDRAVNFNALNNLPTSNVSNFVSPYILCPTATNTIFAGTEQLHKSVDGGIQWTTLNGGSPIDGNPILKIAVSPTDCDLIYVTTAPTVSPQMGIHKSTDGGNTWTNAGGGLPNRFPMDIVIHPNDEDQVWVVFSGFGIDHVWRSTTGGISWGSFSAGLPDVPTHTLVIDEQYPNFMYVGNDLGVYFSDDSGYTWQPWMDNLPDATFSMDLSISSTNRKLRLASHGRGAWERRMLEPTISSIESLSDIEVRFYPNPASEVMIVELQNNHDFTDWKLIDLAGREVENGRIQTFEKRLKIDLQKPGSFTLNLSSLKTGTVFTKKILAL